MLIDHGGHETHVDNGICPDSFSICQHSFDGMFPRDSQQLGVFWYFAANDIAQASHDVPSDVPRPDGVSTGNVNDFDDLPARDVVGIANDNAMVCHIG
jgi:hypothetical protein